MANRGLIGQYAGFVSRAIGLILDILIVIVLIFVVYVSITLPLQFFLGLNLDSCPALGQRNAIISWALLCRFAELLRGAAAIFMGPLYFALLWNLGGQTVGQYVVGVRVVRLDGRRITFARALVRWVGYLASFLALGLGFLWVLVDDRRQGLADKMANTVVIYSWKARQNDFLLARLRRVFRRGKARPPAEPQHPGPIPPAVFKDLAMILVIFENYETLRKVLNLLQDAIRSGMIKVSKAVVFVKDEKGHISVMGVGDLAVQNSEAPLTEKADSQAPDLKIDRIQDQIPNNSFVVALILQERWANRARRTLHPLGLDVRNFALDEYGVPMRLSSAPEQAGDASAPANQVVPPDAAVDVSTVEPASSAPPTPAGAPVAPGEAVGGDSGPMATALDAVPASPAAPVVAVPSNGADVYVEANIGADI